MAEPRRIVLGISCGFHDAAAAVLVDGVLVAAAEEERFTRRKHDPSLPVNALRYCLSEAGAEPGDLCTVAYYEKPLTTYERILATNARVGPGGFGSFAPAVASWSTSKLWVGLAIERALRELGHGRPDVVYAEHHQSHAASAFFASPFERAAICTFDGAGEWTTSSIGWGVGDRIELRSQQRFPDSIGLFYSAFTAYCGFEVNDGEYKLMGLAPFGEPTLVDRLLGTVIQVHDDGSIALDQRYFAYRRGRSMFHPRLGDVVGFGPRAEGEELQQRHADLARSVQAIVEDVVLRTARHAQALTRERDLCLAGGVALNCVANRRLLEDGPFDRLWVQPAAGDSGGAVGAALWAWHQILGEPRPAPSADAMRGAALGPSFPDQEIRSWLEGAGLPFEEYDDDALAARVAGDLAAGRVIGWFQGRMEFGPRALGHRSILADPRDPAMVGRINRSMKGREGFRPFAPAVLRAEASSWFDLEDDRPYMTVTAGVAASRQIDPGPAEASFSARLAQPRSLIPACTHVDGSARVQTVGAEHHPRFHALLERFHADTGCPVLLNTSFNRAGEPIVHTPSEAVRCFLLAGLDHLVVERFVLDHGTVVEALR